MESEGDFVRISPSDPRNHFRRPLVAIYLRLLFELQQSEAGPLLADLVLLSDRPARTDYHRVAGEKSGASGDHRYCRGYFFFRDIGVRQLPPSGGGIGN